LLKSREALKSTGKFSKERYFNGVLSRDSKVFLPCEDFKTDFLLHRCESMDSHTQRALVGWDYQARQQKWT